MYKPSNRVKLIFLTLSIIFFIIIITPFYEIVTLTNYEQISRISRKSIVATYDISDPSYSGTITYVDDKITNILKPKDKIVTRNVYSFLIDSKKVYIISSLDKDKFLKFIKSRDLYFFVGTYGEYEIIDAPEQMYSSAYVFDMLDHNSGTYTFLSVEVVTLILLIVADYLLYKRRQSYGNFSTSNEDC